MTKLKHRPQVKVLKDQVFNGNVVLKANDFAEAIGIDQFTGSIALKELQILGQQYAVVEADIEFPDNVIRVDFVNKCRIIAK